MVNVRTISNRALWGKLYEQGYGMKCSQQRASTVTHNGQPVVVRTNIQNIKFLVQMLRLVVRSRDVLLQIVIHITAVHGRASRSRPPL